jgi:hypothetical protein
LRSLFLIDALKDALEDPANDEEFRRRLTDTYYDDRTDYDTIETILGREEAMRLKLLRESTYSTPHIPELEDNLPGDDAFYDREVSEWTGTPSSDSDVSRT